MSLKKGDLVEVIGCRSLDFKRFVGERFILNERTLTSTGDSFRWGWRSPFETEYQIFSPLEEYLRKVNPDGDKLSNESFESLLSKLKSFKKDNNIVTVNIKLEGKVQ